MDHCDQKDGTTHDCGNGGLAAKSCLLNLSDVCAGQGSDRHGACSHHSSSGHQLTPMQVPAP